MFAYRFLQEGEIVLAKRCRDNQTGLQERTVSADLPVVPALNPVILAGESDQIKNGGIKPPFSNTAKAQNYVQVFTLQQRKALTSAFVAFRQLVRYALVAIDAGFALFQPALRGVLLLRALVLQGQVHALLGMAVAALL